jgi:phage-related protein
VTGVINTIGNLWTAYTTKLTQGIEVFSSVFSRIWNGLGNIARGALNGVINFVEAWINRVIGGVNDLIGLINTVLSAGAVVGVNFQLGTIPRVNLPQLADGGIVMPRPGGVLANIAEAGQPEAVIPLNRLGDFGGGATYNVTVNAGMGADGNKIGQAIVDQILKFERSSGQVFARA